MTGRAGRPRPGAPPARRRGFFLPGVLLCAILLALLAAARLHFSRGNLHMVARLAEREAACHLAEGGLAVGRGAVDDLLAFLNDPDPATFPKRDRAPEPIAALARALLDESGNFRPGAAPFELPPSRFAPLLDAAGGGAELSVRIHAGEETPLFLAAGGGIVPDGREARIPLFVRAVARRSGVPYALTACRVAKRLSVLPPVVGKFALLLRRRGALRENGLLDSEAAERLREEPLVVRGGETAGEGALPPEALRDLIDRQGWVLLGGRERHTLSLSKGGGRPDLEEGPVRGRRVFPIPPGGPLSRVDGLAFFAEESSLFRELVAPEHGSAFALRKVGEVGMTSLVHPAGSLGAPSPTLVLGDVWRRTALIQGLANESTGEWAALPWLSPQAFAGDEWPGGHAAGTVAAIRAQFGGIYAEYARRMCDLIEAPWNAGNLAFLKRDPAAEDPFWLDPAAPPKGFVPPPPSRRLRMDGMAAPLAGPLSGGAFRLDDTAGRTLYDGGPLDGLADLSFLAARATRIFPDGAAFHAACAEAGGFRAFHACLVEGSLDLDRRLRVEPGRGGLLLVRGDVTVGAGISCAPGETLAIVSLEGSLELSAEATVEAALVALQGRAVVKRGLALRGLLAAAELDLARTEAPVARRIDYDRAFDPTDAGNALRRLRYAAEREWRVVVDEP